MSTGHSTRYKLTFFFTVQFLYLFHSTIPLPKQIANRTIRTLQCRYTRRCIITHWPPYSFYNYIIKFTIHISFDNILQVFTYFLFVCYCKIFVMRLANAGCFEQWELLASPWMRVGSACLFAPRARRGPLVCKGVVLSSRTALVAVQREDKDDGWSSVVGPWATIAWKLNSHSVINKQHTMLNTFFKPLKNTTPLIEHYHRQHYF